MNNLPIQVTGGTLEASDFNPIPSELKNIVTDSGQTLSAGDSYQVSRAVAIYAAGADYYTDGGAADAYVLSVVGSKKPPVAYFTGMRVRFRAANPNTGACTVNVAALGAKSIKLADGSTDPASADITTAFDTELVYDGTNFRIRNIQSPSLKLATGVRVNKFSSDGTLVGNSDLTIPTEQAVKTYVDDLLGTAGPTWVKYTKAYTDFSYAGTSYSITLLSLLAKELIHGVVIKHGTPFNGGSITTYTLEVGISGDESKYATAFDVFQAAGDQVGKSYLNFGLENFGSSSNILVTARASHNLNTATQGAVEIWVLKSTLP